MGVRCSLLVCLNRAMVYSYTLNKYIFKKKRTLKFGGRGEKGQEKISLILKTTAHPVTGDSNATLPVLWHLEGTSLMLKSFWGTEPFSSPNSQSLVWCPALDMYWVDRWMYKWVSTPPCVICPGYLPAITSNTVQLWVCIVNLHSHLDFAHPYPSSLTTPVHTFPRLRFRICAA